MEAVRLPYVVKKFMARCILQYFLAWMKWQLLWHNTQSETVTFCPNKRDLNPKVSDHNQQLAFQLS